MDNSLENPAIKRVASVLLGKKTPLPVRARLPFGHENFIPSLLFGLDGKAAIIKSKNHKHTFRTPLGRVVLWKSDICAGVNPTCSSMEFEQIFNKEVSMGVMQINPDDLASKVVVDKGYGHFFMGPKFSHYNNPFTTDISKAHRYVTDLEVSGARKSMGRMQASASRGERFSSLISSSGLELISVSAAIDFLKSKSKGHKIEESKTHVPDVAKEHVEDVNEDIVSERSLFGTTTEVVTEENTFEEAKKAFEHALKEVQTANELLSTSMKQLDQAQDMFIRSASAMNWNRTSFNPDEFLKKVIEGVRDTSDKRAVTSLAS